MGARPRPTHSLKGGEAGGCTEDRENRSDSEHHEVGLRTKQGKGSGQLHPTPSPVHSLKPKRSRHGAVLGASSHSVRERTSPFRLGWNLTFRARHLLHLRLSNSRCRSTSMTPLKQAHSLMPQSVRLLRVNTFTRGESFSKRAGTRESRYVTPLTERSRRRHCTEHLSRGRSPDAPRRHGIWTSCCWPKKQVTIRSDSSDFPWTRNASDPRTERNWEEPVSL